MPWVIVDQLEIACQKFHCLAAYGHYLWHHFFPKFLRLLYSNKSHLGIIFQTFFIQKMTTNATMARLILTGGPQWKLLFLCVEGGRIFQPVVKRETILEFGMPGMEWYCGTAGFRLWWRSHLLRCGRKTENYKVKALMFVNLCISILNSLQLRFKTYNTNVHLY